VPDVAPAKTAEDQAAAQAKVAAAAPQPPAITSSSSVSAEELLKEAREHMRKTACTVLNEKTGQYEFQSVWKTTPKKMGHLGVGVRLYFDFIKYMGIVFLIMGVLSLPSLSFNVIGSMVDDSSPLNSAIAKLSVANFGNCPPAGCQSSTEKRERCALPLDEDGNCDVKVLDVTQWLGLLDGIGILVFVVAGGYFAHRWIPRTTRETDDANLTPSDYTIWIPSVPKYLAENHANYEQQLKDHFQNILKTISKKPVDDPDAIQEVTLVREYDGAIMKFKEKGAHLLELENSRVLHERAFVKGNEKQANKHLAHVTKLENKVSAIERRLKHQAQRTDEERGVCSAFVTFKYEEYKEKVINEYRIAEIPLFRLCQSKRLQFGGCRLKVIEACEPTDLYWENLDYNPCKRRLRQFVVVILTLLVLVACSVVIASLKSMGQETAGPEQATTWVVANTATSGSTCLNLCEVEFFSSSDCAVDGGRSQDWSTVQIFDASGARNISWDASCASPVTICNNDPAFVNASVAWLGVQFESQRVVQCATVAQDSPAKELRIFACPDPPSSTFGAWDPAEHCQAMEIVYPETTTMSSGAMKVVTDTSCATDPADYIAYDVAAQAKEKASSDALDPTLDCFCKQQAKENLATFLAPPHSTPEELLCKEWGQAISLKYAQLVGVIFAVLVLNQVLLVIYSVFIAWERLCTVTQLTKSQLWKLFLAQLVNTGLLMALVNTSIKDYPDALSFIELLSIGKGAYHDMTAQWFTVVGTTLVLTILMQVFSTTLPPLIMSYAVTPLLARLYSRTKVTQEALNAIYTLPQWNLALRLAQTLNVIFCVVMYSGGMPVLYFIGFLYCVVAYWMDKWCLLKGSRRPPAYKQDVLQMSVHLLPMAAFLHTIVAAWTFGNQTLFPSRWSSLKPLAEGLFGITETSYNDILQSYQIDSSQGFTLDFAKARLLDFSREGTWLLMLIFLAACVYYIIHYLYIWLLRPFLRPLWLLAAECCLGVIGRQGSGLSLDECSIPFDEAKPEMKAKGITASYSLAENLHYRTAYKALQHTHESVRQSVSAQPSRISDFSISKSEFSIDMGEERPPEVSEDVDNNDSKAER